MKGENILIREKDVDFAQVVISNNLNNGVHVVVRFLNKENSIMNTNKKENAIFLSGNLRTL